MFTRKYQNDSELRFGINGPKHNTFSFQNTNFGDSKKFSPYLLNFIAQTSIQLCFMIKK